VKNNEWTNAAGGNDVSALSGQRIPNQAERDAAQNAMDNADADKGAAEFDMGIRHLKERQDYISDRQREGATFEEAKVMWAEELKRRTAERDAVQPDEPHIFEHGGFMNHHGPLCTYCLLPISDERHQSLEDVVSGTTRPNETAKGRVFRLIKTWNEDALIIKLVDGEMRDLAAHIAGNCWPDADNQPTFQQDAVQELLGALELVSTAMHMGWHEGEISSCPKLACKRARGVLAKYQVKP